MLPLYHSCNTDWVQDSTSFWCFVNFGPLRVTFLCEMKFSIIADQSRLPSFCSVFRLGLVIGLWAKIWHRNKNTCSYLNPVQSSRSKSRTGPRKGRLLKFELNSTATSLGNDARRDSFDSESNQFSLFQGQWAAPWALSKTCVLKLSAALQPFCVALSLSVHWHALFILLRSLWFFIS